MSGQCPLGKNTSPAFEQDPPTWSIPAAIFANNADASLDPWNRGTGSGDTEPDTELVHTWWGRRVASSSVHANAAVNGDFDPRGGVNKRGRWDECARWGRLGDVPYRSALSLHNVTWWSRRWKGNVQSVPRSLCPVHSLAPPQALNPRNAVR